MIRKKKMRAAIDEILLTHPFDEEEGFAIIDRKGLVVLYQLGPQRDYI